MQENQSADVTLDRSGITGLLVSVCLLVSILISWESDYSFVKYLVLGVGASVLTLLGLTGIQLQDWRSQRRVTLLGLALGIVYGAAVFLYGMGSHTIEYLLWGWGVFTVVWIGYGQRLFWRESGLPGPVSVAVLLMSLYGLAQATGFVSPGVDSYGAIDYSSVFGLSNFSVEFMVPLLPLIWHRQKNMPLASVILVCALLYIVLAGARSGYVAVFLAVAVYWALQSRRKVLLLAALGVVAGFLVLVLLSPRASDTFRMEAMATAWSMFLANPMGVGIGWFADAASQYMGADAALRQMATGHQLVHPHNEVLRLLAEAGVAGLLFLVMVVAYIWKQRERVFVNPDIAAGCSAFAFVALVSLPGRIPGGAMALGILIVAAAGIAPLRAQTSLPSVRFVVYAMLVVLGFGLTIPVAQMSTAESEIRRGQAYLERELPFLALKSYRRANRAAPYYIPASIGYATLLHANKEYELAFRTLKDLVARPYVSDDLLLQALSAGMQIGANEEVGDIYRRHSAQLVQGDAIKLGAVGTVLTSTGNYTLLDDLAERSALLQTPEGVLLYAQGLMEQKRYESILEMLQAEIDAGRSTLGQEIAYGIALEHLGEIQQASAWYDRLLEARPDFAELYLYRARIPWLQQDADAAYEYVQKAFSLDPRLEVDPTNADDEVFFGLYKYVVARVKQRLQGQPK